LVFTGAACNGAAQISMGLRCPFRGKLRGLLLKVQVADIAAKNCCRTFARGCQRWSKPATIAGRCRWRFGKGLAPRSLASGASRASLGSLLHHPFTLMQPFPQVFPLQHSREAWAIVAARLNAAGAGHGHQHGAARINSSIAIANYLW
jgi:hypothetical protein